ELDEGALLGAELKQRAKARLVESRSHRGTTAMVNEDVRAGIREERHHVHELIVLDLDIDEHVERDELLQERLRIEVVVEAVVRDVPCHADDTLALEHLELVQGR